MPPPPSLPPPYRQDKAQGTRKYSHMVLKCLAAKIPELMGGSADLTGSNNTDFKWEPISARYFFYIIA